MTPSLANFLLSLAAGLVVVAAIAAAVIWVSSNDQLLRD